MLCVRGTESKPCAWSLVNEGMRASKIPEGLTWKDEIRCVPRLPLAARWKIHHRPQVDAGDQPGSLLHGRAEAAGSVLGRDWESEIRGVELGNMNGLWTYSGVGSTNPADGLNVGKVGETRFGGTLGLVARLWRKRVILEY